MKKTLSILILVLAATLTACGQTSSTEAIPTVVLDAGTSSNKTSPPGTVTASAEVVPVTKVELSFPLTGIVKTVEVKAGDQVTAGNALVTLDTVILEAKVTEAEANLVAAETQVRYLRRVGTDEEHQESARADVDRAQAMLDSAKATLAQATLIAPIDGTIASVDISQAETVVPGQIVIVIGDLSHFQIETTDLSERDVPSVQVGQQTNVFIEALNADFGGKVVDIARQSTTVGGDVVFKVTIELDEQPQGLYWGMSADVEIQTGE
jgi:multidrug efflux pump subunit AcrA (membrane-fusion protein)